MAEDLKNQALARVDDMHLHLEAVTEFVDNALTGQQLDRVLQTMETCNIVANSIINQPQPPPPPPVAVVEDEGGMVIDWSDCDLCFVC